jgi:hypothetical protein
MFPITRSGTSSTSLIKLIRIKSNGVNYSSNLVTELNSNTDPQLFVDDIDNEIKNVVDSNAPDWVWSNLSPDVAHFALMAFTTYSTFKLEELEFTILDHNDTTPGKFIGNNFKIIVVEHYPK